MEVVGQPLKALSLQKTDEDLIVVFVDESGFVSHFLLSTSVFDKFEVKEVPIDFKTVEGKEKEMNY
jgi:hypothetical protein